MQPVTGENDGSIGEEQPERKTLGIPRSTWAMRVSPGFVERLLFVVTAVASLVVAWMQFDAARNYERTYSRYSGDGPVGLLIFWVFVQAAMVLMVLAVIYLIASFKGSREFRIGFLIIVLLVAAGILVGTWPRFQYFACTAELESVLSTSASGPEAWADCPYANDYEVDDFFLIEP